MDKGIILDDFIYSGAMRKFVKFMWHILKVEMTPESWRDPDWVARVTRVEVLWGEIGSWKARDVRE